MKPELEFLARTERYANSRMLKQLIIPCMLGSAFWIVIIIIAISLKN